MPRKIKVATVQMDAAPAPKEDRLARAADLIAEAASSGAQLIVLPELFNTGYIYDDSNYAAAEPLDGPTATWMKAQAAQHRLHLAGTFLALDGADIFNTALLLAPDGRRWRYDKNYPFLWERAYFRGRANTTVADTDLGKLGMLICWDSAHSDLWEQYAGKVDAMLVMSCPPKISAADLVFPDGRRVNMADLGALVGPISIPEEYFPGKDMDEHAAWLGVPVAASVGCGVFRSIMPRANVSLASYLAARPDLWKYLPQASEVHLEAGYDPQCKVIDADGHVLTRAGRDEGFTIAEIELKDSLPQPVRPQPKMRTLGRAYILVDRFGPLLLQSAYRRQMRRLAAR